MRHIKNIIGGKGAALLVAGLVVGIGVSWASTTPPARASFFGDIWKSFVSPFTGAASGTASSTVSGGTQLVQGTGAVPYAPTVDYETAVVRAVKRTSPAVVSIIISKDVPIIEQCPGQNPFSNLPPEFQQFFGDQGLNFSVPCQKGTKLQEVGGGSGFIISQDGLILTNKHVVADTSASYTVLTNDGKKYPAKVLARDPLQDLAVIKIDAANLPTVTLGDSDSLELGQTAIAIGNALGEFRNTVSVGVVSGLARTISASGGSTSETLQGVIQTDAAINPGNSGGPLLDLHGDVIGINTAVASNAQNIGFAIPINRAKRDIASVESGGTIQAPYLGVRYLTITPDIAAAQKLPVDQGALVRGSSQGPAVEPNSPAAQAGIMAEDIIVSVHGVSLDVDHPLGDIISGLSVGEKVPVVVQRGGKEVTLEATIGARPGS